VKAKNRVGEFDLRVREDDMIGIRISIYLAQPSMIDDLLIVGTEAASFGELKAQVDLLKADLDAILAKSAQYFDKRQ
jgi:hypothetical protein